MAAKCTKWRRSGDLILSKRRSPNVLDRVVQVTPTSGDTRSSKQGRPPAEAGGAIGDGVRKMVPVSSGARHGLRCCVLGLAAIAAALSISSDAADARHHHRLRVHYAHRAGHHAERLAGRLHRQGHAEDYSPPSASIVVDGNSGAVLQASNPDAPRHPASLTKVMTLYLLFERLDTAKIKLDTPLKVSEHASGQDPTKLDLKPGQIITVEDAIKGVVTKSANDAAVAIAESLGGDEDGFAKLMTQKARALGMTRTTYVNASGLPNDDQITTARDQALLGRAIQDRFPRYYRYFSTESFVYHGEAMRNHNHLLGAIEGVDGIKTGFTRASGFNLLTSVHRDGRYVVAVVLGGQTASERDAHMRELIGDHIKEAALHRTAPSIADGAQQRNEAQPVAFAKAPMTSRADPTSTAVDAHAASASNDPIRPLLVRTISYRTAPVQPTSLGPLPALIPVTVPAPAAKPVAASQPSVRPQPPAVALDQSRTVVASADPVVDVKVVARQMEAALPEPAKTEPAMAEPVTAEPVKAESAKADIVKAEPAMAEPAKVEPAKADLAKVEPAKVEPAKIEAAIAIPAALVHAHGGWLIQIGAYDDEDQAMQHLSAAQIKVRNALAAADPFTERILKGDKALYRARFAGFDKATAETACKQLKRSDFDCMALKD
jgi:D-alanyl-D-alanine carboxypeptidase